MLLYSIAAHLEFNSVIGGDSWLPGNARGKRHTDAPRFWQHSAINHLKTGPRW